MYVKAHIKLQYSTISDGCEGKEHQVNQIKGCSTVHFHMVVKNVRSIDVC